MSQDGREDSRQPIGPRNPPRADKPAPASSGSPQTPAEDNALTVAFNDPSQTPLELPSLQPTLEVVTGQASQRVVPLGKSKLKIGRSGSNDLVLSDQKASREHALVYFDEGHYIIEDLKSTNGVFINDKLVHKIILKSGDRITIGDSSLLFTQKQPEVSLAEKQAFIEKSDLFNWLDSETKLLLAQSLLVRVFPKDAVVLRQSTLVESMYFLYSGEIRIVEINEEGGERAIDRLKAGDFFGERALLAGEAGKYSMVATRESALLELRKEQLNALLQKKPELNQAFYRMVLTQLRSAQVDSDAQGGRKDTLHNIVTSTDVQIVGADKKIQEARKKIEQLAKEDRAALIVGPAGTGKKTFARYFHKVSPHPDYPYVEFSALDEEKSKGGAAIFGIEADPLSTHTNGQVGYLEMIGMGTLTIAHAELLDAHQQSKLVTYIRQGWFHRNYGQQSVKASTRVVFLASGTEAEVLEKFIPELREELKNRTIALPPLIQRLKDIPILADHFLKACARSSGKRVSGLSREATEKLVTYSWPGNVKELENVIERSAIVSSEDVIIPGDLIFVVPSEKEIHKVNLLRRDGVRDLLRHPLVPKLFTWFNIFMVLAMAGFTLYGGTRPPDHPLQDFGNNPGMLITWLVWFPLLPISAFLFGRAWCGMCPIVGIGDLVSRVKRFNLPVPKVLKRLDFWVVIVSFLVLDYFEDALGVADFPWATAMLLVTIITLSVLFCVLFERKTFCRHVCPLAGLVGTYGTMSVLEIRGNKKVCQTQCGTMACYKGTERADGCPMFAYPASLESNAKCMLCLNCVKSCENRGVQLNLRPPLQELWGQQQPLLSISLFAVMLVGLMASHQFHKLTFWIVREQALGWSEGFTHFVHFFGMILAALAVFALAATLSAGASQERPAENMARYGLAFVPLALSGHLSNLTSKFLGEGLYLLLAYVVKLYDWLVHSIPIGSREVVIAPFVNGAVVTFVKVLIILGGAGASLFALVMIARRFSKKHVFARMLPHLLVLTFFLVCYLAIFTGPTGPPAPAPAVTSAAPGAQ